MDDVLDIALLVSEILERLGVPHMVTGSLASSLHGIPRATQDIDLVADLSEKQIEALVDALAGAFYVDAGAVREAVRGGTRFNAIHLDTVFKVDIYMPTQGRRGRIELDRARPYVVSEDPERRLVVASAEDTIVQKLRWFRLGDEVSERQWKDALGILRVQGDRLDRDYLREAAEAIGVEDLLDRAIARLETE